MDRRGFLAVSGVAAIGSLLSGRGTRATGLPFRIERFDNALDGVLDPRSAIEVLASGFAWTEGPAWDSRRNQLYFSDIPGNRVHRWSEAEGLGVWREPAGSGGAPDFVMPGTNGLHYLPDEDALLVCDQDSRSILKYDLAAGTSVPLVTGQPGSPFNSPNDLVVAGDGTIYFTDPPYGLPEGNRTSDRLRPVNGVYECRTAGEVRLVDGSLSFPNGVALSPDERVLYVSVSDPAWPRIVRYLRSGRGWRRESDCWFDMRMFQHDDSPGMPDGLAVSDSGVLFATAPGGVAVLSSDARLLGRIVTARATGNCCLGAEGTELYITAADVLVRIALKSIKATAKD